MSGWTKLEEERLGKIARGIGWELVSSRARCGRLVGQRSYKIIDPIIHEVVYGEQDDLDPRDLGWFLEDRAKAELPRLRKEAERKHRSRESRPS